jgi:hypothetical protein
LAVVAVPKDPDEVVNPLMPLNDQPEARSFEMAVWVAVRSPFEATMRTTVWAEAAVLVARTAVATARNAECFITDRMMGEWSG